ncbi:MAG: chromosome segregation protein SMC [Desulfobacteraceae bacterium 4572_88]|nr:MAG: chromosome segregation protein SMC [Desulfobacteraceae bacterium 4572_88]
MITSIQVSGFKSLRDIEIELGTVNVFIGANGSGKSNILEAVGLLSSAASGRIDDESLIRRGVRPGLPRLYKSSFKHGRTRPHIRLTAKSRNVSYSVALLNPLKDPRPSWEYKAEELALGQDPVVTRRGSANGVYDPTRGLAAVRALELGRDHPGSLLLNTLRDYAIYSPGTSFLRGVVSDPQTRDPVGLSGGGLASALLKLQKLSGKDERIGAALEDVLSALDWAENFDISPSAGELLSPSVPRPRHTLRFRDRHMLSERNTLTAYDASEGALYLLFVAVLALSPASPACLAVDNLDQALNPRLLKRLVGLLCNWVLENGAGQILCTVHNPAAIDGLLLSDDRARLFAVDRNNYGCTTVRRVAVTPELLSLCKKKDWPLSRLWMMGHIGGVPSV